MYQRRLQSISVRNRAYALKPLSSVSEGTVGKKWRVVGEF